MDFFIDDYSKYYEKVVEDPTLTIIEIEGENGKRKFRLTKLSNEPTTTDKINNNKYWFDTYYTQHEQKLRRLHTLGLKTDEGKDPYSELMALYAEAETKRREIQSLE